jgi:hypothetical protein
MLSLLTAILLAAPPAPPAAAPVEEATEATTAPPPAKLDPAISPKLEEPSGWQGSQTQKVVAYAILEGLFVGYSALASHWPQQTGWVTVATAPLGYVNMQRGETLAATTVFVAGAAGLGLYNALELRGQGYSRGQRFWINMAAWNALAIATQVTYHFTRDEQPSTAPSMAIGVGADGPVLMLAGRF